MGISLEEIEFRTVRADDPKEFRTYLRIFWDIPLQHNRYFTKRSDAFIDDWMASARAQETEQNTHSGIAVHGDDIVGIHILRAYEEYERQGAHIAGLWVREDLRRFGIARRLKEAGEAWARSIGAEWLNTNVQADNAQMLRINERAGFRLFRMNLRKDLV